MERCIIAAVADNGAIGKDNDLLWHIAEDMRYFRRTTTGNPVVMGYRTFLSIGRPLPKRVNIVISTRSWDDVPEGVIVAGSLEEAYSLAEKTAKAKVNDASVDVEVSENDVATSADGGRKTESGRIFIMGGGETYRKALPTADKLFITHVHAVIKDADTFFRRSIPRSGRLSPRRRPPQIPKPATLTNSEFTQGASSLPYACRRF